VSPWGGETPLDKKLIQTSGSTFLLWLIGPRVRFFSSVPMGWRDTTGWKAKSKVLIFLRFNSHEMKTILYKNQKVNTLGSTHPTFAAAKVLVFSSTKSSCDEALMYSTVHKRKAKKPGSTHLTEIETNVLFFNCFLN
jgi:hypothetical protein